MLINSIGIDSIDMFDYLISLGANPDDEIKGWGGTPLAFAGGEKQGAKYISYLLERGVRGGWEEAVINAVEHHHTENLKLLLDVNLPLPLKGNPIEGCMDHPYLSDISFPGHVYFTALKEKDNSAILN
jgi:hypothetical protein